MKINNINQLQLNTKLKINPSSPFYNTLRNLGNEWQIVRYRNGLSVCVLGTEGKWKDVWREHLPVIADSMPFIKERFLLDN